MGGTVTDSPSVADAYLGLLVDRGVTHLFANAGTDFAPLIEAYAKRQACGEPVPRPVTVPHENVAVTMATGFFLMTGRPQAVMVHVNVGTANAICGLMNAARGQLPLLFTAGRTPYLETGDVPGKRTGEIHWPQEMRDQGGLVREFMKWDYTLPDGHAVAPAIDRALAVAMSEPRGPVSLTLPREVLAAPMPADAVLESVPRVAASAPAPDPDALEQAAAWIAAAENPLIITSNAGRDPAEVSALSALANAAALPVSLRKPRYVCLTTDDPMHHGFNPDALIAEADLIIVAECDVPWIPGKRAPRPDCRIVHLGSDPLFAAYPMRGFRADLAIAGSLRLALPALLAALEPHLARARDRIETRRRRLEARRAEQHRRWAAMLEGADQARPMDPVWITHCLDRAKPADAVVIKESPLSQPHMRFDRPGTYFSVGAAGGLGWGLGTALGIKMAAPERTVICTVGDGAYMFGNPLPAHYVGRAEGLPTLTVVFNNEMWGAVKRNTREVYPDGHAARSNREPLTYFEPGTRFEKAIEAVDGHGECVEDPAKLPAAIDRALDAVAGQGRPALLNVICRGP